jgi:hypothetical protein
METCNFRLISCLVIIFVTGCLAEPVVHRPQHEIAASQSAKFLKDIQSLAEEGDWIVTRGYHAGDVLVANATGIPISHTGIYDRELRQVIEADAGGVHATELSAFIEKSHRLIVIRPRWSTPESRRPAILRARELIGKRYDYLGTIGFDSPSRFYCSELAVQIYRPWHTSADRLPDVIKPGELYLWGKILYDSLPRGQIGTAP